MIFVSVGTQLPFPRMLEIINKWSGGFGREINVVAQTADSSIYPSIECYDFLPASEFNSYIESASLIVSHAGMGNILTALEREKPIVIFAREAALGEHRNDHQLATAKKFENHSLVRVVSDFEEFYNVMSDEEFIHGGHAESYKESKLSQLNSYLTESVNEWFKI